MKLRFFRCRHPADLLIVEKEHTVEPLDADFDLIVYHCCCLGCGALVTIRHAKFEDRALRRPGR